MNDKEMLLHYAKSWKYTAKDYDPPSVLMEPICRRYWRMDLFDTGNRQEWEDFSCLGCPVMEATGKQRCEDTPIGVFWEEEDSGSWVREGDMTPEEGRLRKERALECAAYLRNLAEELPC